MKEQDIVKLLPSIMREAIAANNAENSDPVLAAFIKTIAHMHAPIDSLLNDLDAEFDPMRAREAFLPMLSHWLNLDRLYKPEKLGDNRDLWRERTIPTETGFLRELLSRAVSLSRWRGTGYGLREMLFIATGISDYQVIENLDAVWDDALQRFIPDPQKRLVPFHILVLLPAGARDHTDLIKRIIEQDKPAYVTATILDNGKLL